MHPLRAISRQIPPKTWSPTPAEVVLSFAGGTGGCTKMKRSFVLRIGGP